jgi:hypothetical protein
MVLMTQTHRRGAQTVSRFVDTTFVRMHLRETDGVDPPILALHGFPDNALRNVSATQRP